jgi:hypothetical protein
VVAQAFVNEVRLINEVMHGHEFDCGDPEFLQVADAGRRAQTRVSSAQFLRNFLVQLAEAFDMPLVN